VLGRRAHHSEKSSSNKISCEEIQKIYFQINWGNKTNLKILKSWSISESPGNSGALFTISAKMHPIDQMSTEKDNKCLNRLAWISIGPGVEYCLPPSRISGALKCHKLNKLSHQKSHNTCTTESPPVNKHNKLDGQSIAQKELR